MPRSHLSPFMRAPIRGQKPQEWFTFRNVSDDEAEIDIYGQIAAYSFWDDEDEIVTARGFRKKLKDLSNKKRITVHINSPGGSVFEGLAIYNALKQHDAEIKVVVDALAASAASFIAMAADEGKLVMARNAVMMIHDASGLAMGNAADMREMADLLDMHSDNIADIYAQRTGEDAVFWRTAMEAETWYTGSEAVNAGLADSVLEDENTDAEKVAASFDLSIYNYAGREQAPAPSVIHKRIKAQLKQAKENTVSGPTTPKAHGDGTGTPAEGEGTTTTTTTETTTPAQPEEPATDEPAVEETPAAGADGDGQPVPGTQPAEPAPENRAGVPTFLVNGVQVTDPRAVQAHITALETAAQEARDGGRTEFVNQLVTTNRLPATELEATVAFALELSDTQYESWQRQWTNAASLPLLARHGGGSTNENGAGSHPQTDTTQDRIEVLEGIVAQHKRANRTEEFIKNSASYKELVALKPDFHL